MDQKLLTIPEFCEVTSLGRTYVYKLLKLGELKAVKIGRRTFIRREDAQTWISSLSFYPTTFTEKEKNYAK